MSTENVINFLVQAEENTDLKTKLEAVKTPDELLALAQKQGYEVSPEDFKTVKNMIKNSDGELSEDELEAVAGGGIVRDTWQKVKDGADAAWTWFW